MRSKTRIENEIAVGEKDQNKVLDLLSSLGFEIAGRVMKTREIYELKEMEISLDVVPGLGVFIEIEITSEDIVEGEERMIGFLKELGWTRFERRSYLELLFEKENQRDLRE
jgi:adenylate cyclase class 2